MGGVACGVAKRWEGGGAKGSEADPTLVAVAEEWILDTSHIKDRTNLANFIREGAPA